MQNVNISSIGKHIISTIDLYEALKSLGVKQGDVICVHSQLMNLGKPLLKKQEFLERITETLLEAIGEEGTLIMPTFSYSFCKNEVFDVQNTPSDVGILTEYFRNMPYVKRTWHPIFSFAVSGARTEEYLDIGPDAFSLDSVYGKMIRDDGKIVMMGANAGYTFYYLAEEHLNVSHRYFKNFNGQIKYDNSQIVQTNIPYFVRALSVKSDLDEKKLSEFLRKSDCQRQVKFAHGTLAVIECEKAYSTLISTLKSDENIFL